MSKPCGICGGSGAVDSGGFLPWGEVIFVKCGYCDGTGMEPEEGDHEQTKEAQLLPSSSRGKEDEEIR